MTFFSVMSRLVWLFSGLCNDDIMFSDERVPPSLYPQPSVTLREDWQREDELSARKQEVETTAELKHSFFPCQILPFSSMTQWFNKMMPIMREFAPS